MMKTLFLQAPSFDGFDGGAGARYQARREIQSFWYPTWLAQPAALRRGLEAHRCAAPPAEIPGHRARRREPRPRGAAYVHSLLLLRCQDCRSAQGAQAEFEDRHDRGQGRGRAGRDAEGVERHRFRRPQRVRFHHQGRGGGPRLRPHRRALLAQRRRSRRAQRGPRRSSRTWTSCPSSRRSTSATW